jgi:type II secretion system protein L
VLLRRLESGQYVFGGEPEAAPLTASEVAGRLRGTLAYEQRLHLLVPAARCLLTQVPVAKHEARHLGKTLPWTLEERVLEPVEQLHVAHGPVVNGTASVAVINAAWLKQALDELRGAGIQPDFACSELFMLPWQAGRCWTSGPRRYSSGMARTAASPARAPT